jgi:hypothetical protein
MAKIDKLFNIVEDFEDEHVIDNDNSKDIDLPIGDQIIDIIASMRDVNIESVKEGQVVELEHEQTLRELYELANDKIDIDSFIKQGSALIAADHIKEFDNYYPALDKMESELKAAQE